MKRILSFLPLGLCAPVLAQTILSAEEFAARTQGNTITFVTPDGAYYGAEQYLDGQRVRWMYADGTCTDGSWFVEAGNICFRYDDQETHQCWVAEDRGGRLFAYTLGAPPQSAIGSTTFSDEPLPCPGPDLGV